MHRKILLLDDSAERVERCREALAAIGGASYRLIQADTLADGLAQIEHERPDCVLINWSLRGNGALPALHRICTRHAQLPVIVLVEEDTPCRLDELTPAIYCHIFRALITPVALHAAIQQALNDSETRRTPTSQTASHSILVIDDSPHDRELCVRALGRTDERYRVIEAEAGEAGLALIDYKLPDCVLLDYSLPGLSGLEVLQRIQAIDAFLPVIMLTGREDISIAVQAMKAGAQNYLPKSALTSGLLHQAIAAAIEHADLERLTASQREQIYQQKIALAENGRLMTAMLDTLKTSEETFRSAMEHAPCGMALIDLEGRFLKVNKALCAIAGCDEVWLCDMTLQALTHPEDVAIDAEQRQQLLAGEVASYAAEKRLLRVGGDPVDVELNLSLVRANQQPHHFVAQIQDIRERKEVDRLKNEFVAVFSHELRTPLTSIRGSLDLLSEVSLKDNPATTENLFRIARRNCERLIMLINDILDIETLASRHMLVEMQPAMLSALVREAVESSRGYADSFKVGLALEPLPDEIVVTVDPARFLQVLSNLISNAVKFSPPGEEVTIAAVPHEGRVRVQVRDRGPGVPDAFRSRLFQKFTQADGAINRRAGGSGLGLYICKQLAEHMGGGIGFETAEGHGSTFWIELPATRSDRPALFIATRR